MHVVDVVLLQGTCTIRTHSLYCYAVYAVYILLYINFSSHKCVLFNISRKDKCYHKRVYKFQSFFFLDEAKAFCFQNSLTWLWIHKDYDSVLETLWFGAVDESCENDVVEGTRTVCLTSREDTWGWGEWVCRYKTVCLERLEKQQEIHRTSFAVHIPFKLFYYSQKTQDYCPLLIS